jgi:hypothetical protein
MDPDDDYQPRETDHLVEPMFAGLGVGEEGEEEPSREEPGAPIEERHNGWLAAIVGWLRRRFR